MDGIDLRMGCHDFEIENITGRTGDDTIALTAIAGVMETAAIVDGRSGDIRNVKIRNVLSDPFMLLNVQVDQLSGDVTIGNESTPCPPIITSTSPSPISTAK